MATSAANAASSDSNRAAYVRNLDFAGDRIKFRLDSAALSAFDVLLELPIVENQILPAESDADREPVDELKDDDQSIAADDESRSSETETNPNPIFLPITNRIEETLKRDANRDDSLDRKVESKVDRKVESKVDRKVDREFVIATSEPSRQDSNSITAAEVTTTDRLDQATTVGPKEAVDNSQFELIDKPRVVPSQPTDSKLPVEVPNFDHIGPQHDESVDESPVNVEVRSLDRKNKSVDVRSSTEKPNIELSSGALSVEQAADPKHAKKLEKSQPDQESIKRSNNTTPSVNRRSERLADTKRGERSNDSSDEHEREAPEAVYSAGSLDIPKELTVDSEQSDPTQSITLSGAELTDPNASLQDTSAAVPGASTSILSTGIVATSSIATSAVGLDGNREAVVNSIGPAQGTATISENSSGRSITPLTGRGSTLSQYQEHRVLQRVLKGFEQLDDGGGQVRLRLHPPELGSLQVTLRVDAQQVSALIEVEHSAARDVLLSNLPQLQSRLADQGLNVSQFDVQVIDPNQFSQGSGQGWESRNGQGSDQNNADSNRSSRYIDRLRNQLEPAPTVNATRSVQSLWTRKNGELDVRV